MRADVKDITGKRFGKLTVLKISEEKPYGPDKLFWLCKCDCGKEKIVPSWHLRNKKIISCGSAGCGHEKSEGNLNSKWCGYGQISGSYWCVVKMNAKSRNLTVQVNIEQAWKQFLKQDGKCALSGDQLIFAKNRKDKTANASLDRINSKLGYTVDNIQWLDKTVNVMKQALSDKDFVNICRKIVNYRQDL